MSDCRCSGAPGQNDTWDYHSDYCPVYMQGRIAALEEELAELREAQKRVRAFPVALRKMWSGREVEVWIEKALQGRGYGI